MSIPPFSVISAKESLVAQFASPLPVPVVRQRADGSAAGYANEHFLTAAECDFLGAMKCGCPEAPDAANDRADARAFSSAENPTQQSTGSSADRRALDGLATPASGFDCAFHIDLLARRCMVELDDFRVNRGASAVCRDEAVEPQHHAGMALNSAGPVDLSYVTVHSRVSIVAFVHDGRAKRVADFRTGAGQGVIETDAQRHLIRHGEFLA